MNDLGKLGPRHLGSVVTEGRGGLVGRKRNKGKGRKVDQ